MAVDQRFGGKVAVVTGAASGLGRATALRLAEEGANVAALDVALEGAERTVSEMQGGGKGKAYGCDVSDPQSVWVTTEEIVRDLGAPNVLCNVAGILSMAHTTDVTFEDWSRVLAVNLTGTFLMCQAVIPHLLATGGNIVNVASSGGVHGQPYSAAYGASKGGVISLTKCLAVEYMERGLRVNAIAPGGIDTSMTRAAPLPEGASRHLVARIMTPFGMTSPEHVAGVLVFLASDEADYMTGAIVSVDGGITT